MNTFIQSLHIVPVSKLSNSSKGGITKSDPSSRGETKDEYIRVPRGQARRRVHTTGNEYNECLAGSRDEYIRVPRGQETSTYDRKRVQRVPRGQETSTYECLEVRRRVHKTGNEYECLVVRKRVHTSA